MNYSTLNIEGTEYKTLLTAKFRNRKKRLPSKPDEIRTAIPGTVIKLNVKKGDKVNEGDVLMLFEAMKMQNIVHAPHSGEITVLDIKEGDSLPKNALIAVIST